MEVSIITGPNKKLNIEKELQLVKVGLLYSDKVNIVSPSLTMIFSIIRMSILSEKEKLEFFREIVPIFNPGFTPTTLDQLFKRYKQLKIKKGKNKEEMNQYMRLRSMLDNFDKDIGKWADNIIFDSGLVEGYQLIENGSLSLNILNFGENSNEYAKGIMDETIRLLSDVNSYPIFDEMIEDLANSWIKEKFP